MPPEQESTFPYALVSAIFILAAIAVFVLMLKPAADDPTIWMRPGY